LRFSSETLGASHEVGLWEDKREKKRTGKREEYLLLRNKGDVPQFSRFPSAHFRERGRGILEAKIVRTG